MKIIDQKALVAALIVACGNGGYCMDHALDPSGYTPGAVAAAVEPTVHALSNFGIKKGDQFKRKDASIYLECKHTQAIPSRIRFSFSIFPTLVGSSNKDYGHVLMTYDPEHKRIDVTDIEVKDHLQGKGHGGAALTTAMSVMRSKLPADAFNRFSLTSNLRAEHLYSRLGFSIIIDPRTEDDRADYATFAGRNPDGRTYHHYAMSLRR